MKGYLIGDGLKFCNMSVCGDDVDFDLPCYLQFVCEVGCGSVYLKDFETFSCENALVAFSGGEVCVFFVKNSNTCVFQTEFVANFTHTAVGYSGCCNLSCGGDEISMFGYLLENCDCVCLGDDDYIFCKFKSKLSVLRYCSRGYEIICETPATSYEISSLGERVDIEYHTKTSCGGVLFGTLDLKSGGFCFSKVKMHTCDNYNAHTFPTYFFEVAYIARLLSAHEGKKLISQFLGFELSENPSGVLEYLGDFCGMIPHADGVFCFYMSENGGYVCRDFSVESSQKNSGRRVENVQSEENPKFPPLDFCCLQGVFFGF